MFGKKFPGFRTNLIAGILTLSPLAAVVWFAAWFWNILLSLRYLLPEALDPRIFFDLQNPVALKLMDLLLTLILFTALILLIALVGKVSKNMIGQRLIRYVTKVVARIPVLNTIYTSIQQLLDTFATSGGKNFRKVVSIEYPRKGLYTLALVTGERQQNPITGASEKFLTVYVPTTPNPTSGFYLIVPATEAKEINLTVEEALKQIISMGMIQ